MKASDFIINVSEADFEYEVIAYSQQNPVVVDFWAEWCIPCRTLSPLLEKLAEEGQGSFRLAKVEVDGNPNLALRFNVRSLPAVKAFRDGQVIAEFVGVQPESKVREFLRSLNSGKSDLLLEKAQSLLIMRQWPNAEKAFQKILEENPGSIAARLGLLKSLIVQGRIKEAQRLLKGFPLSKESISAEALLPLIAALENLDSISFSGEDPFGPAYQNALKLITRGNIPAAMDGLLDILRQDKHYRSDEVRKVMISLFELLFDEELSREYRNELASVLF